MSVSVSMPQLGESVTEGTVTRWLKREGEHVEADEPLLEVSTDKVDTEIPSPVSGILRGITVAEDETVAVGAELAVIDEEGSAAGAADTQAAQPEPALAPADQAGDGQPASPPSPDGADRSQDGAGQEPSTGYQEAAAYQQTAPYQQPSQYQPPGAYQGQSAPPAEQQPSGYQAPAGYQPSGYQQPGYQQPPAYQPPAAPTATPQPAAQQEPAAPAVPQAATQQEQAAEPAEAQAPAQQEQAAEPAEAQAPAQQQAAAPAEAQAPAQQQAAAPAQQEQPAQPSASADASAQQAPTDQEAAAQPPAAQEREEQAAADGAAQPPDTADSPYVTPLVRKLAAEHGINLATVAGTGVGGRIRKQDVLDAAQTLRGSGPPQQQQQQQQQQQPAQAPAADQQRAQQAPAPAQATAVPAAVAPSAPQASARPAIVPSSLRGTTERMSRARQVIAQRMVESLQTSAQLTTVVEADVTAIARLRERAKAAFEAREGVKLSFLPFFALALVEALKVHPKLNAVIDTASGQVTYHDDEHLGIAVDTDRGLMVPVLRGAGDLNIAGLARKIADIAQRTRAGRVSPDDLSGGTFTLTNTGSRGALFDTPIINQPQVGILGTGTVVKRAVVVDDPALGEVITVRSMVYLALTYDHRLVDGADAARFLVTMKARLEEGAFETELGL